MKNYTQLRECPTLLYLLIKKTKNFSFSDFSVFCFFQLVKEIEKCGNSICAGILVIDTFIKTYCLCPQVASRLTTMVRSVLDNSM